jgi:eukaryotic-like serine/threonine-protein kinase
MGEVWRGTDLALSRAVAVKLLHPEHASQPDGLARFRAEARHAGSLSHPNIAQIYDYCEPAPPDPAYLVMELVDGPSLARHLDGGPLSPARTLDVIEQAASGLAAAHRAGLLHRDIKPGNLLLSQDGLIKITDFGIARAAGSVVHTRTGALTGTPAYLAPERFAGTPATPATDLYALGVVAHQCLTGQLPFAGDPLVVALAHVDRDMPPLPESVPADLAALVADLTRKDPHARPASAIAVLARAGLIRAAVSGSPANPAPAGTTTPAGPSFAGTSAADGSEAGHTAAMNSPAGHSPAGYSPAGYGPAGHSPAGPGTGGDTAAWDARAWEAASGNPANLADLRGTGQSGNSPGTSHAGTSQTGTSPAGPSSTATSPTRTSPSGASLTGTGTTGHSATKASFAGTSAANEDWPGTDAAGGQWAGAGAAGGDWAGPDATGGFGAGASTAAGEGAAAGGVPWSAAPGRHVPRRPMASRPFLMLAALATAGLAGAVIWLLASDPGTGPAGHSSPSRVPAARQASPRHSPGPHQVAAAQRGQAGQQGHRGTGHGAGHGAGHRRQHGHGPGPTQPSPTAASSTPSSAPTPTTPAVSPTPSAPAATPSATGGGDGGAIGPAGAR